MHNPQSLQVIDVNELCVVFPAPKKDCKYVTLSYVWGGVKSCEIASLNKSGLIDLKPYFPVLPQTILDAINVTKAIGMKYL